MLDSDGHLTNNCYDFIQKRENLLDDVIFLCRSLGFSCYKTPCIKICTNTSNGRIPGIYYRCCIGGEGLEEIPCLLSRKMADERQRNQRVYVTGVILKEYGETEIYRLITDKPKYLMSDFTVRHRYESEENNDNKKVLIIKKKQVTNVPFGYRIREHSISINEKEAEIIRIIFDKYYDGITLNNITDELNSKNLKTRTGKDFIVSSVNTILRNREKYIGAERENGVCWPKILFEEKYLTERSNRKIVPIFGYSKNSSGEIIINEEEANIVRLIDFEHRKGTEYLKIVEKLNNANMKYKNGENWTKVKISLIIKHKEKYRNGTKYPKILN